MSQYDQPIADIAQYVFHHNVDATNEVVWERARTALLDSLGCAIETVATSAECWRLLGPVVPGTTVPNGFRIPGTQIQLDPVEGAFALGALVRYLDHNDALGGAEWGHPSGRKEYDNDLKPEGRLTRVNRQPRCHPRGARLVVAQIGLGRIHPHRAAVDHADALDGTSQSVRDTRLLPNAECLQRVWD